MSLPFGYEALLGGPSKLHQAAPAAPPSAPASAEAAAEAAAETAAPMEEDRRFQGMVNIWKTYGNHGIFLINLWLIYG